MAAIALNTKAFDIHFIRKRGIILKWKPQLITHGQKFKGMKMEHLVFLAACPYSRVH